VNGFKTSVARIFDALHRSEPTRRFAVFVTAGDLGPILSSLPLRSGARERGYIRRAERQGSCFGYHEGHMSQKSSPIVCRGNPHAAATRTSRELDVRRIVNDQHFASCMASLQGSLDVGLDDGFGAEVVAIDETVEGFELGIRTHRSRKAGARVQANLAYHLQQPRLAALVA
jgi:hypothetical protein